MGGPDARWPRGRPRPDRRPGLSDAPGVAGAADDAGGAAAVREAVPILKAAGLRPRRTIRVGLRSGEVQGFPGSRERAGARLASRPGPKEGPGDDAPPLVRRPAGPLATTPDHGGLAACSDLDSGGGKVRGI